ncbi:unnamed protein product, partial [marine sediment metagenome]
IKTGRKVTSLHFEIKDKTKEQTLEIPFENQDILYRLTKQFLLSEIQAKRVILQVPEKEINKILYEIRLNMDNIKSLPAYTYTIFKRKYKDAEL